VEKIGPYQILKELGRGGMGVVYRGVDPVIGRHVAIKTLRPEDMGESSERGSMGERLLREARSAGILSHPSIVTIYQAGQDQEFIYIAMEFVDGANLADVLAQGRLNIDATLKILKQSAEALDYAHSKGVVHRDIKPGNLLLEPSGKIKIADFGIAKLNQAGVTKTTSSVGSPAYMSPEHVRAQSIDGRADQYSLGVVAHEMLTGRRPHDSEELTSLVFKVVFEPPDLSLLQALPKGNQLEPIFARVLSKAADERYASCMEFYEALASVLEDKPHSAAGSPPVAQPPVKQPGNHMATVAVPMTGSTLSKSDPISSQTPPPAAGGGNKGLLFGGIGVLAIALAVGGYFMFKPADNPKTGGGGGGGGDIKQEQVTPPVLIKQGECAHTAESQASNLHGTVRIIVIVNESGEVEVQRVAQSVSPVIDELAKTCVKGWLFQPSKSNGKPVRSAPIGLDIAY
jgi:TonB family protein